MEIYAYHQIAVTWEISHKIEQPSCFSCDRIMDFLCLGWKIMFAPELLEVAETPKTTQPSPKTNSSMSYA
ncbi:MAG: hypothetical protein F6K23_26735 [Okeania sp. SIO2C9]|uniref:hypothetical protein n=1 Tax=Okeania sp. SIO2C9 TaxID=2607791 RepID=UPI0013C24A23|nr:hypothetical protein [Okeania sp. SIO2C9]NEQ76319.1 hypothetical protein [Okeania sp. SIO2C9]